MAIYCFKKLICALVEGLHLTPINCIPCDYPTTREVSVLPLMWITHWFLGHLIFSSQPGPCPTFLTLEPSIFHSAWKPGTGIGAELSQFPKPFPVLMYPGFLPAFVRPPFPRRPLRDFALCSPSPSLPSWHISPGSVFLPAVIFVLLPPSSSHPSKHPPPTSSFTCQSSKQIPPPTPQSLPSGQPAAILSPEVSPVSLYELWVPAFDPQLCCPLSPYLLLPKDKQGSSWEGSWQPKKREWRVETYAQCSDGLWYCYSLKEARCLESFF